MTTDAANDEEERRVGPCAACASPDGHDVWCSYVVENGMEVWPLEELMCDGCLDEAARIRDELAALEAGLRESGAHERLRERRMVIEIQRRAVESRAFALLLD